MAATDKCKLCKFFKDQDSTCHLSAPAPVVIRSGENFNLAPTPRWPTVLPTDWCGQFTSGTYKG